MYRPYRLYFPYHHPSYRTGLYQNLIFSTLSVLVPINPYLYGPC